MNKIYLPTLKSIRIKDFSLYPNGLDFNYKFINGVNIIFGGNGLGKTTFINLIKYGLIGLYEKRHEHRRTYKGRQIAKRKALPADYFSRRMDTEYSRNDDAKIILTFKVNETIFEVTRTLKEALLESVKTTENGKSQVMSGKTLEQVKYDGLEEEEKEPYLQKKYEAKVAKCCNLGTFDDLIFFVTLILFFEENHKTILWDENDEGILESLSSKYWNDPELDQQRQKAVDQSQYFDSLSRHKSEDIRSINEVIKSIQGDTNSSNSIKDIAKEMESLKNQITRLSNKLDSIHSDRDKLTSKRNIINNDINVLVKEIQLIEAKLSRAELEAGKQVWEKLNPAYKVHNESIRVNNLCPMCNKQMPQKDLVHIINHGDNCFMCDQPLNVDAKPSRELDSLQKELRPLKIKKQQFDSDLAKINDRFDEFEDSYRKLNDELFSTKSKLWTLEHSLNKKSDKDKGTIEFKAMLAQISKLEGEKKSLQEKAKKEKDKVEEISKKIESENLRITVELSNIFADFAEEFLGLPAKLTYDDFGDGLGKRFVPIIDGKERLHSRELSESQRFFIDHSYRMSLLHFFYNTPSFFVCETPDSSLDISYESHAANVFLNYLRHPNSLIITSNLNNSQFLQYIIDKAPNVDYVNLLEMGRPSRIQAENPALKRILDKIKTKLDSK